MSEIQVSRLSKLRSRGAQASWMAADQVLSSGTNLLLLLLVLRTSSGSVFGAFSAAVIVQGLLLGSSRALIGEVLLLRMGRSPETRRQDRGLALTLVLGSSAVFGLALAAVGAFLPEPLRGFFLVIGVAVPFVHVQDLQRYGAFAVAQPRTAVALDLGWLVVQAGTSAILLTLTPQPRDFVLAWAAGAAVSAAAGLFITRWAPSLRGIHAVVLEERGRSGSFFGDFALSAGVAQAAFLGSSGVLTLAGFGLLRFALTVVSALTNVLSSARILTLGFFGRRRIPDRATWQLFWGAGATYVSITVMFVGFLLIMPRHVGMLIFGPLWLQAVPLLGLAAIVEAIRVASFPAIDFLKAFIAGSALVTTRSIVGLITASSLLVGGAVAGPRGALVALAAAYLLALALWLRRVQVSNRRMQTTPAASQRLSVGVHRPSRQTTAPPENRERHPDRGPARRPPGP
ncbi:MAG: hypothetical protein DLM61_18555 [Pseudonocardiales bacterium]|nr:MAG: hypothetical protein DLM61_18555 [Pseudonocardiales bacterium]